MKPQAADSPADAPEPGRPAIHRAIQEALDLDDDGDLLLSWHLTFEAVLPNGRKWLGHRAGGGHDGNEAPQIWAAIGMLEASLATAHRQLGELAHGPYEDEGDDEDADEG